MDKSSSSLTIDIQVSKDTILWLTAHNDGVSNLLICCKLGIVLICIPLL